MSTNEDNKATETGAVNKAPSDPKKRASVGEGTLPGATVDIIWLSLPLIIALPLILFFDDDIESILILTEWGMISISLVLLAFTRRVVRASSSKQDISEIANGIKLYFFIFSLCLFSYIISFIAGRGYVIFREDVIFALACLNVVVFVLAAGLNSFSVVSEKSYKSSFKTVLFKALKRS